MAAASWDAPGRGARLRRQAPVRGRSARPDHLLGSKGKVLWTHEAKAPFINRPAVQGKFLLAASADGRLVKLDAGTAACFMSRPSWACRPTSPIVPFEDERGKISAVLAGDVLGPAALPQRVQPDGLLDERRGPGTDPVRAASRRRARSPSAPGTGPPTAWMSRPARSLWRWTENDNFYYSPGRLRARHGRPEPRSSAAPDGFVSAVDAMTGKTVWRVAAGAWESFGLSADGRRVLVKSRLDEFHILDAADGPEPAQDRPGPRRGRSHPVAAAGMEGPDPLRRPHRARSCPSTRPAGSRPCSISAPATCIPCSTLGGGRFVAANVDGIVVAFRIRD